MIDFAKLGGVVPVVVQDATSKDVLMLGFMNEEAWQRTVSSGKVWYYSRKRRSLWMKGEQSGHVQIVRDVRLDCDSDSLLLQVDQVGGACDLGFRSCFDKRYHDGLFETAAERVFDPATVYPYDEGLRIALPSGSLERHARALVQSGSFASPEATSSGFSCQLTLHPGTVTFAFRNPREIPSLVASGHYDGGITGLDWVVETDAPVIPMEGLGFNKCGRGLATWAVVVPDDSPITCVRDLDGLTIIAELHRLTEAFLRKNGVLANVVARSGDHRSLFSGSPAVDLVETGSTIAQFRYKPICPVLATEALFIAGPRSYGYTWKRRRLEETLVHLSTAAKTLPQNEKQLHAFDENVAACRLPLDAPSLRARWFTYHQEAL